MKMKKGKNVASLTCDTQIRAYKAAGWAEVKEKTKAKPDPDPAKTGGFDGVEKMMQLRITGNFESLVRAFEAAPEKTERLVSLQVKMAVRDIREYAADNHRFVARSGDTEKSIVSKAEGNAGAVWLASPVAVYQHEGTPKHEIVPRNKRALRWAVPGGFAFAKRVNVSGIKPDPYLYKAAEYQEPRIMARCDQALDKLLGEI